MAFPALLGARILAPNTLRNLFLELGTMNVYRPLQSERIEDGVTRTILHLSEKRGRDAQESREYIKRLIKQADTALPDTGVVNWEKFEHRIPQDLDPNDRHVVAAAIVGRANVVVTFNINDFPESFAPREPDVLRPDEFLLDPFDLNPRVVQDPMKVIVTRNGQKGPEWGFEDLLERLERKKVPRFAAEIRQLLTREQTRIEPLFKGPQVFKEPLSRKSTRACVIAPLP